MGSRMMRHNITIIYIYNIIHERFMDHNDEKEGGNYDTDNDLESGL